MSKGSWRRPEDREAIEKNWPLFPKQRWECTDCGSVAWGIPGDIKCPRCGSTGVFQRVATGEQLSVPLPQADGFAPYPWCRLGTCRGSCPRDPNCGD